MSADSSPCCDAIADRTQTNEKKRKKKKRKIRVERRGNNVYTSLDKTGPLPCADNKLQVRITLLLHSVIPVRAERKNDA